MQSIDGGVDLLHALKEKQRGESWPKIETVFLQEPICIAAHLEAVGNVLPDGQLALQALFHQLRHLAAALVAAKGRAAPPAARHQLEGPCGDFLAGCCHSNHNGLAPAAVGRLELTRV